MPFHAGQQDQILLRIESQFSVAGVDFGPKMPGQYLVGY